MTCCAAADKAPPPRPNPLKTLVAKVDRVWLALGGAFLALVLFDPGQAAPSFTGTLSSLVGIAPWLALAVITGAYAKASGADRLIAKAFHGNPLRMIFFAALIGGLSPFCSCGVVPLIAALLTMGVPVSAVLAFCLASPLMDPTMFLITSATLGTEFAIAKTLIAVGIGLFGGYGALILERAGFLTTPLRPHVGNGGCAASSVRSDGVVHWAFWKERERIARFFREGLSSSLFLLKWLTLAFFLETLMLAYVPAEAVSSLLGPGNPWALPAAVVVGVPAYFNGFAALPLAASLVEMGTSQAVVMAFLVAGGVSSLPAAMAVAAIVRPAVFAT